jgi:hypothetical protein
MQNLRTSPASGSVRRPALFSLGAIGLMLVGIVCLWWTSAMKTPVVHSPTPVMPHPNAFDFYVTAGNAVTGDKQISDAIASKPTATYTLAQKEALVQQNVGAINTLHQGFAYPYLNPPSRSVTTLYPYYAKFRGMARLLSLRGRVRAARGDWNGAADSYLDAIRIGEDMPRGSVLIGYLVGVACQAIGRRPMWETVDHLNAAQSRAAATRLESIMDRHFPFADTLQEEKWFGQYALLDMFSDPKKLASDPGEDPANSAAQHLTVLVYLAYSKRRIMGNYTTWMDQSSQVARQPYGLHLPSPPLPSDPINRVVLPVFSQARLKEVTCETQDGLLLVTLALHAFHLEHGHYPASLTELAPGYLKRLPDDPFAVQGTFKYLVKGGSYVLYSVGPDGNDDGGTPIDDPKQATTSSKNARYYIYENSVGDVVAGKNIF